MHAAADYRRAGSADYRKVVALDYKRSAEAPDFYRPASDFGKASLPTWWLSLQQLANVPANISFTLVCSILLPSEVARIVPASQKAQRLGTAAMIGAIAQLLQPVRLRRTFRSLLAPLFAHTVCSHCPLTFWSRSSPR